MLPKRNYHQTQFDKHRVSKPKRPLKREVLFSASLLRGFGLEGWSFICLICRRMAVSVGVGDIEAGKNVDFKLFHGFRRHRRLVVMAEQMQHTMDD